MGGINIGRMLLAGLIAAVVFDATAAAVNASFLADEWNFAIAAIGRPAAGAPALVAENIRGALAGFVVAWIYAGFRPRFGGNRHAAIFAGVTVWVLFGLVRYWTCIDLGLPRPVMAAFTVASFFEIAIASFVGNYFYQEA